MSAFTVYLRTKLISLHNEKKNRYRALKNYTSKRVNFILNCKVIIGDVTYFSILGAKNVMLFKELLW